MSVVDELHRDAVSGVSVTEVPEGLSAIASSNCPAVIWRRDATREFQAWIDALPPEQLPKARAILRPEAVRDAMTHVCEASGTPDFPERRRLIDDIAALADVFASVMGAPWLRLRLDAMTTNACRKFHVDAVTARLVCTYRGTGTQYGMSAGMGDPDRVFTVPTSAPIVLRGTLWPTGEDTGFLHRSPPIEGTGETRLVLVLDPIFHPEEDFR
ncbi:DUF1826 domain-containing protein [Tropicimonas marinistellae]|uniref:DUF1826 domain-containing protein n=1 Tax=Tropicimonas marinistellae TaxID=1739787 RepID=UPI00082DCFCA|nr:DUF1826 domain-containing protein [Tropicimonas marinistellae]